MRKEPAELCQAFCSLAFQARHADLGTGNVAGSQRELWFCWAAGTAPTCSGVTST